MANFITKKLYALKLQEELAELEKSDEFKKQNTFIEDLQKLLKKNDYTMQDLKCFVDMVYSEEPSVDNRGRPKGTKYKTYFITYKNVEYKVNEAGRQNDATRDLLNELNMTPKEFIEKHSK